MNLLVVSLLVLVGGAVLAVALLRWPRLSLLAALGAVGGGSGLYVAAGVETLLRGPDAARAVSWPLPLGAVTLALDGLAAWFLLTIGLLSLAVAIYSWPYLLSDEHHAPSPRATAAFGAWLCLMVAAMGLAVCAADVMLFLVAWELMSVASFFLIGFHDQDSTARRGAWSYLIATHLGTALCLLPMFALIIAHAGWNFSDISALLRTQDSGLRTLIFFLGLVGFGTKAGFMPLHVWLPIAHPVAPTPVSALLSGVMVKTGIYAFLRLLTWLGPLPASCGTVLIILGVVSGVMGVLYALAQHDIKRLLAYHTVENIGIIALGIGVGLLGQSTGHPLIAALGFGGALLHVLNHALFKGLLFLSAGAVIHSTGTGEIDRLGGLAKKTPANAALFLLAALAICGLPPLNGFVSEWLIYGGLLAGAITPARPFPGLAILGTAGLALMGGLALACFAKVFSVVFLGEPREDFLFAPRRTPRLMLLGMAFLALCCILIGLAPLVAVRLLQPSLASFIPPDPDASLLVNPILAPLPALSALAVLLLTLIAALTLLRRALISSPSSSSVQSVKSVDSSSSTGPWPLTPGPSSVPTWSCGYAHPTPRMQYTASSFAWSLLQSFRRLLWPQRHLTPPQGLFPALAHLETHTPDLAESDLFNPLFRSVAHFSAMLRTLTWTGHEPDAGQMVNGQWKMENPSPTGPLRTTLLALLTALRRGSIQVCLGYIAATLLAVFLLETCTAPKNQSLPTSSVPSVSSVVNPSEGGASEISNLQSPIFSSSSVSPCPRGESMPLAIKNQNPEIENIPGVPHP